MYIKHPSCYTLNSIMFICRVTSYREKKRQRIISGTNFNTFWLFPGASWESCHQCEEEIWISRKLHQTVLGLYLSSSAFLRDILAIEFLGWDPEHTAHLQVIPPSSLLSPQNSLKKAESVGRAETPPRFDSHTLSNLGNMKASTLWSKSKMHILHPSCLFSD